MVDLDIDLSKIGVDLGDILGGLPAAFKLVTHFANRNTRVLQAASQATFEDWVIEERQQTGAVLRALGAQVDDIGAVRSKLVELVSDPQFARVRDNYGYEACREAIDERRRMLAFASAGSINLQLTIAQTARVERTVRELDPGDVLVLKRLTQITDPQRPPPSAHYQMQQQLEREWGELRGRQAETRFKLAEPTESLAVLVASGCTHVGTFTNTWTSVANEGLVLTDLGKRVLVVLDGYVRARSEEMDGGLG